MTRIIDVADLSHSETSYEFEGHHHGNTSISFIVVSVQYATLCRRDLGSDAA